MNPYPVIRPDGSLSGYCCSVCDRRARDLERVDGCCRCTRCGKAALGKTVCDPCWKSYRFASAWGSIGKAIRLGVTNAAVWRAVEDQLDYGDGMSELLAEIDRHDGIQPINVDLDGVFAAVAVEYEP